MCCAQGVEGALQNMVQLGSRRPNTKKEGEQQQEMYDLIEKAEMALDQEGRSTFRKYWDKQGLEKMYSSMGQLHKNLNSCRVAKPNLRDLLLFSS
jgi:hypothetical protein